MAETDLSGDLDVLIITPEVGEGNVAKAGLDALGQFSSISVSTNTSTLNLTDLTGYEAVLTWSDSQYADPVLTGNVLADFVDGGGGVVLATYSLSSPWWIQGRTATAGYAPLTPTSVLQTPSGAIVALDPADEVFAGVDLPSLTGTFFTNSNFAVASLADGAELLATDGAGRNMIARNANGNVIAANLFPGFEGANETGYWTLFANMIISVADGENNGAPTLDLNDEGNGTNVTLAYTENREATAIAAAAVVSDSDSADFGGGSLTIEFTEGGSEADQLTIQNQGTAAGQIGVAGNTITHGGVVIGTFSGGADGATLTISLNTSATAAAAQALTRNVLYSNNSDNPSNAARTLTFTLNDGDGGSTAATATVTVTPVNDAPVLTDTDVVLDAVAEDAGPPVGAVGTLVSAMVGASNVTDADEDDPYGIALIGADTANGSWFYSTDNGANWNSLGAVSESNARLLAADAGTRIYFQPNANFNGTLDQALTFHAWDRSSGENGGTADLLATDTDDTVILLATATGGATAFSAETDTVGLTITASNDDPTAAGEARTVAEDATKLAAALFTGNLLTNDTDIDGEDLLRVGAVNTVAVPLLGSGVIVGTYGTLTVRADGSYTYALPNTTKLIKGESDTDEFTYTVDDGNGGAETATLTITVEGENLNLTTTGTLNAHRGSDIVQGSASDDSFAGRAGNDDLRTFAGDDRLWGEAGDDTLVAGADSDQASGGEGNDRIWLGSEADSGWGGDGDDEIFGEAGQDNIYGGDGNDELLGGADNDLIYGQAGNDTLGGQAGDDKLVGGPGNDFMSGEAGNDMMWGEAGADTFLGGSGADQMMAGGGDDRDVFVFTARSDMGATSAGKTAWDKIFSFDAKTGTEAVSDVIDLRPLDADPAAGNQVFRFRGTDAFTAPGSGQSDGQVRIADAGAHANVHIDYNGDNRSDHVIQVMNIDHLTLSRADFLL